MTSNDYLDAELNQGTSTVSWEDIYLELKKIAHHRLKGSGPQTVLSPTVLVHEAYMKLSASGSLTGKGKTHLMALASRAMRFVLIDYVRKKKHAKDCVFITLKENEAAFEHERIDFLWLNSELERLDQLDSLLVQVVECRFFAGLSVAETAVALELNQRKVERLWQKARLYLLKSYNNESR